MENVLQLEIADVHPLMYPAPKRCRVNTANGYATQPWTYEDVRLALCGGAWFSEFAGHEFDCQATKRFALSGGREVSHED